jgi:glycosyltransferase involved in cell wall biosynthesis
VVTLVISQSIIDESIIKPEITTSVDRKNQSYIVNEDCCHELRFQIGSTSTLKNIGRVTVMARYIFVNRFFYPDHSATSQILTDLVFYLSQFDTEIHVVTSRLSYEQSISKLPAKEKIDNITIHRVWTSNFGRINLAGRAIDYLTFYMLAVLKLVFLVKRNDLVISKTDPPLISIFTTLIANVYGAKTINWLQDLFPEVAINLEVNFLKGRLGKLLIRLRNYSLRNAASNVVLGEKMRKRLVEEGISPSKINVIHNWSVSYKASLIHDNPLRTQWGLDEKFVIGYSGNLGRAHDSQTIINAMIALKDNEEIIFLFIGGGSHFAKVQQACVDNDLSNVLFKPYQPRELLHLSLSAVDVHWLALQPQLEGLIVPSKFYGIAAAGKPIIFLGDANGELAKLIDDFNMGFVISLGDYQALVDRFHLLASNITLCEQIGTNNRKVFDRKFDNHLAFNSWRKVLSIIESEPTIDIIPSHQRKIH